MKLQVAIHQYITYRRSLGEKFRSSGHFLKAFARTIGLSRNLSDVRRKQVNKFLAGEGAITATWHCKYTALAGFYSYAMSRGYLKASPLPVTIPKRPEALKPYIYTTQELSALLKASLSYPGRYFAPYMIRTFLLLLYGAGMRLSEAIHLKLADVDLPRSLLTIRDTKFYKTRLVPVGKQLTESLSQYALWRRQEGHSLDPEAPFFVNRKGSPVHKTSFGYAFNIIRNEAGVRRPENTRFQPRIHDLRHSFAVHRLTEWYKEGADVQKWLPALSQYLGHACLSSTSVYLTMTPVLLAEAGRRFQNYAFKENLHD